MKSRALFVLLAITSCSPRAKDSASPDTCPHDPSSQFPEIGDEELAKAAGVSHVVVGRVRWTGGATANEYNGYRAYRYVIVDIDEFLRGDPWSVAPKYRRSFPLLTLVSTRNDKDESQAPRDRKSELVTALECRNEESFLFFVELPSEERLQRASARLPGPVERAFGPYDVPLHGVLPASERERLMKKLAH